MSEVKPCTTCRWHQLSDDHAFTSYRHEMHLCVHPKLAGISRVTGEVQKTPCHTQREQAKDPIFGIPLWLPYCGSRGRMHELPRS